MRRVCLILCLSLITSLIHVGSVFASHTWGGESHAQQTIQHDCHHQASDNTDTKKSIGHQAHHQCCLGVIANLSFKEYGQANFSNHLVSQISQLIIEPVPNHIFKPPRQIS